MLLCLPQKQLLFILKISAGGDSRASHPLYEALMYIIKSPADIVGIKPEVVVSSSVRLDGDEVDINITWILQVKL